MSSEETAKRRKRDGQDVGGGAAMEKIMAEVNGRDAKRVG